MRTLHSRGYARARTTAPRLALALLAAVPFACERSQNERTETPTNTVTSPATAPSLGTAESFLVLGGSTVTNTGATTVQGDLGVAPGLAVTGFPPGLVLGGVIHAGDATALQAQDGVTAAYVALAGDACGFDLSGQDLGGLTLVSGVYCFSSAAQLTGTLVLDAQGDPDAVFIFQIGSTLTTASNAAVTIVNAGQDCRVFWQVGSSATLGTNTAFAGSILALASITLATGATVSGRALARNGAVTMDSNQLVAGTCASSDAGAGGSPGSGGVDSGSGGADAGVDASAGSGGIQSGSGGIAAGSGGVVAGSGGVVAGSGGVVAGSGGVVAGSGGNQSGSGGIAAGSGGNQSGSGGIAVGSGGNQSGSGGSSGADAAASCCGILCGASCTNPTSDTANCGSCGNACASNQTCTNGSCKACSAFCGGECVDLDWDPSNCGACGTVCSLTEVCENGACTPCATLCGGVCTYTGSVTNCGACGNVCLASESCQNGACTPCATLCAGECADLDTDTMNCGACGHSCSPGETCSSGLCLCE